MQAPPRPRRLASAAVPLGITVLLASGLTACGGDEPATATGICVDEQTQQRTDDERCDPEGDYGYHGGFGWYFIPIGLPYPAYGAPIRGYRGAFRPAGGGRVAYGGLSRSAGSVPKTTVSRGGFGGSKGGGVRSGG